MARSFLRSRTALILPMVLLIVALLEEIAAYKVRQHVRDLVTRTAIIVVLNGLAFAAAATWIGPWIKAVFVRARTHSRRGAGSIGLWLFYGLGYAALFYAYYVAEQHGPGGLLPAALR